MIIFAPMPQAFCINQNDNVATLLDDLRAQEVVRVLGHGQIAEVPGSEPIALGHKIALRNIATGEPIVKFGVQIGRASSDIRA